MTANEAVSTREQIKRLSAELTAAIKFLNSDSEIRKKLSAEVGVLDIASRLDYANRLLDDYDTVLSKALQVTELSEVML